MVNFLKQFSLPSPAGLQGFAMVPHQDSTPCCAKGKARCSSVQLSLHLKTSHPPTYMPEDQFRNHKNPSRSMGRLEDLCLQRFLSTSYQQDDVASYRMTDCIRATVGPKVNLNAKMNHFTGSESNYFL